MSGATASGDLPGGHAPEPTAAPTTVEAVVRERIAHTLGGWRGSVETAIPTIAFVVDWTVRKDVREAVVVSVVACLLLAGVRLAQRQTVRFALSSLLATAIAAAFALRSGNASDAFVPGMLNSALWFAVSVVTILVRWPLVGLVVGAAEPGFAEDPFGWRRNRPLVRVCSRLTWVLAGLYAIRLALMVPAYLAGQVALLGIFKIVLGWPLYLGALAVMAALLLRGHTPYEPTPRAPTGPAGDEIDADEVDADVQAVEQGR